MAEESLKFLPRAAIQAGWFGAFLSWVGALSLTEWLAVLGTTVAAVCSIASAWTNARFKRRRLLLYQDLVQAKKAAIQAGAMPAACDREYGDQEGEL
jgi:hypothetical protein